MASTGSVLADASPPPLETEMTRNPPSTAASVLHDRAFAPTTRLAKPTKSCATWRGSVPPSFGHGPAAVSTALFDPVERSAVDDDLTGQAALGHERPRFSAGLRDDHQGPLEPVCPVRMRVVQNDVRDLALAVAHHGGGSPRGRDSYDRARRQKAGIRPVHVDDEHPVPIARHRTRMGESRRDFDRSSSADVQPYDSPPTLRRRR